MQEKKDDQMEANSFRIIWTQFKKVVDTYREKDKRKQIRQKQARRKEKHNNKQQK